jgi:hypothetical protein
VHVPCTITVCGACLFSFAKAPFNESPLSQFTVMDCPPWANAAAANNRTEIILTKRPNVIAVIEIVFDMLPP